MNQKFVIKNGIHRRCQVAMCSNIISNSIARTNAPAGANLLICDDCLREAYEARFGVSAAAGANDAVINALAQRIAELEAQINALKADVSTEIHAQTAQEADTAPQTSETVNIAVVTPAQPKTSRKPAQKGGGR